jgi:chaperonin GroEL (HSP60 family)
MKKAIFLTGLVSGVVLARWWRELAKEGIKFGIQAGHKINEISQKAKEELEDVAAEATTELSTSQQEPQAAGGEQTAH